MYGDMFGESDRNTEGNLMGRVHAFNLFMLKHVKATPYARDVSLCLLVCFLSQCCFLQASQS